MEKAQVQDLLEYYELHKGEAFIYGVLVVKLLGMMDDEELGTVLLIYDDVVRQPVRLSFVDTHLTQLKGMIDDDDYSNILHHLDTNFAQYLRNQEEKQPVINV